jgi:hypothetical protein
MEKQLAADVGTSQVGGYWEREREVDRIEPTRKRERSQSKRNRGQYYGQQISPFPNGSFGLTPARMEFRA